MLRIRFFRVGKKKQASFKIVVTDKRNPPKGGRFVEEVGFWNPMTKEKILKAERIKYWLSKGAKPSNTVYNLLLKEKILEGKKIPVHKKKKEKEKSAPAVPAAPVAEKPGASEPKEEKPKALEGKPKEEKPKEAAEKPKETKPEESKKEAKEEKKLT